MKPIVTIITAVVWSLVSAQASFAQDEFYNRDSSGYTYRMGLVPPKIEQDWQLGSLGRDFTFGFNPVRCEYRELRPEFAQSA